MSLLDVPQWFPWNGSKRWIVKYLTPIFQTWTGGSYIEPFVGGGSISALMKIIFPNVKQYLSDANPWLMSAFQSQLINDCKIAENYMDIDYWRNLRDIDFTNLSVCERANRFAICLFTAWGNRWKSKMDGSMGSENPINKKFGSRMMRSTRISAPGL